MIRRDDHDRSPWTAPNKRLHLHPRGAFYEQYQLVTAAIRVVHNHPSGDPTPSRDDLLMTEQVRQAAECLGIALQDHVIVGNGRHTSFRREGLL
ncbi:JAB domain-containing protein [Roseomonas mucosa]|uniref:JAB domain-containing protein n=1 Tax=Roseomonas mucosa TaxID=207340 RepID=UPI003BB03722